MAATDIELSESEVPASPTPTRDSGCMMCNVQKTVKDFRDLRPGDEISMPGRVPICGILYRHHAVVIYVENVTDNGRTAELTVIDVDEKGKLNPCIPCNRKPISIKNHHLYNQDKHVLSTRSVCLSGPDSVFLEKVYYRKRKFDEEATAQRARICYLMRQNGAIKYCFCLQNCEHFTATCVNGQDTLVEESPKESISPQALNCFWIIMTLTFWLLQTLFYGFDLMVYALYEKHDKDFMNITIDEAVRGFVEVVCVRSESRSRYFRTTCDWWILLVFAGVFTVLFLAILLGYYLSLYRKNIICKLCFVTMAITLGSRLFLFVLIEVMNILLKSPFYDKITQPQTSKGVTICALLFVAGGGSVLVYSLSSLMAKGIMWVGGCIIPCSKGYSDFVPFRGFMWCFYRLWRCRCCCNRKKETYSPDEIIDLKGP